jgi:hypothetical protein
MIEQAEEQDGPVEHVPAQGKGFFILNLLQVERMVEQGAGAEEVMTYLVPLRGSPAQRSHNPRRQQCRQPIRNDVLQGRTSAPLVSLRCLHREARGRYGSDCDW